MKTVLIIEPEDMAQLRNGVTLPILNGVGLALASYKPRKDESVNGEVVASNGHVNGSDDGFKCKTCGKVLRTVVGRNIHIATVHRVRMLAGGQFGCKQCNYTAPSRFALSGHMRRHR